MSINFACTISAMLLMLLLALLGSSGAQTIDTSLDQPIIRRLPPWRPPVVDIKYFGGPVASDPIKLYLIWYGTWDTRMKPVVRTMINSFTPSKPIADYPNLANWWKIVEQYQQKDGKPTSSSVSIGAEVDDVDFSSGKNFSGPSLESFAANELYAIVQHAITISSLPVDISNGAMYVVLFAEDVYIRHELIYCGNHHDLLPPLQPTKSRVNTNLIYVHLPSAKSNSFPYCNIYNYLAVPPPNGDVSPDGGLDTMLTAIAHEVAEAATNPLTSTRIAWIVNRFTNSENGDLCALVFGGGDYLYCDNPDIYGDVSQAAYCRSSPYTTQLWRDTVSGVAYNVYGVAGSRFLVQQMWALASKGCQLQFEEPCKGTLDMTGATGTIQVGEYKDGKPLHRYMPGADCKWNISVTNAKNLSLTFRHIATGYDNLDYINVYKTQTFVNGDVSSTGVFRNATQLVLRMSISEPELENDLMLHIEGSHVLVEFKSFGGRSPYPESTGFLLDYKAGY